MIGFEFYDNPPHSPEQNGQQSIRLATGDRSGAECRISSLRVVCEHGQL